jgi:1-acyl-sn-glycerol-3-phosphate acyltransferase
VRRRILTRAAEAFYWTTVGLLRFLLWLIGRWTVTGRENIPRDGGLIVVANHISNTDPPILAAGIARRHVHYMAKVELFHGFMGWLPRSWAAFPVRRFEADLGAMLHAERLLRQGRVLGMFPEGTRSRTGRLGEPHPGTALIALRTGAPVLPCAITGTEQLRSPKFLVTKPRITITIGKPIAVERTKRPSEAQVSSLTNEIFSAIRVLLPAQEPGSYTQNEGASPGPNG